MFLAVQKSSNIYVARLVQRVIDNLGEKWFRDTLVDMFDFGKKTNVEYPAEIPGLVPTIGKYHPNGRPEWSLDTPYSLAMGHNILVNSMQMIRAFAIIANGGYDVRPTFVRKIIKDDQVLLDKTQMEQKRKKILSQESCQYLIEAMKYTTKIGGTAPTGDIMGYSEAGKSGTSEKIINGQYSHEKYISSFIGIAPANNPRFVLMVVLEEPEHKFVAGVGKLYHGGICAAPVFREMGKRALQYLGIPPDDPFGYPFGDPRRDTEKADWMVQVKNLRKLYQKWNGQ